MALKGMGIIEFLHICMVLMMIIEDKSLSLSSSRLLTLVGRHLTNIIVGYYGKLGSFSAVLC